jgi:hypothetical protein
VRTFRSTRNDVAVGTLVTLDLPDDSPVLGLPWIITFAPLDEGEEFWEPVVCGPYERAHALALAEAVVVDEDLMAVVEPLQPAVTVDQIRGEIAASRLNAEEAEDAETEDEDEDDHDHDHDHEDEMVEPSQPPSPEEIRAGFARIAEQLAN